MKSRQHIYSDSRAIGLLYASRRSGGIHPLLLTLIFLFLTDAAVAQLQLFPLKRHIDPSGVKTNNSIARTKEIAADTLPFWDDFSKATMLPNGATAMFPDTSRWEDSFSVWVNDGMAIHPPTINVATFDGLDSAGEAYNPNEILATGYTDNLTSRPLDLSEGKVALTERAGVYLSFFYQWSGNVEAPDPKDFLQVDFKTADADGWQTVMTIFPRENPDAINFYDTIIQVTGDQFFHDKFQFRFRSFGRLSGPFDAWNLDYVYLNKDRNINDLSFPDRAVSTRLGPLFGPYRSIPRDHFFSNEQLSAPAFEIQNLNNGEAAVNFRTDALFSSTDFGKDTITYQALIADATPINLTDNVLFANEHKTIRLGTLPDINNPLQFPTDPGIDSTLIRLTISLQTKDNVTPNDSPPGDYTANYRPIQFTSNDTITADYALSSYYAYDDGVAEYSAGLIESGNLIAYQFEMDTSYAMKQDTLIGFDVYFPPYGFSSGQRVDFFIYRDSLGMPDEVWLAVRSVSLQRSGNNRFQRIQFLPALLVDESKFYIGWKQPSSGEVLVGLDMSNDTGDKIFVNTTGSWYQNDEVRGSLMIRPVFGTGIVDASVGIEDEIPVAVYPNPSYGSFYIAGTEATSIEIFSLTGQKIEFVSAPGNNRTEIRILNNVPGVYILRYAAGNIMRSQKIIIRR